MHMHTLDPCIHVYLMVISLYKITLNYFLLRIISEI
jgi:hypothetical protein